MLHIKKKSINMYIVISICIQLGHRIELVLRLWMSYDEIHLFKFKIKCFCFVVIILQFSISLVVIKRTKIKFYYQNTLTNYIQNLTCLHDTSPIFFAIHFEYNDINQLSNSLDTLNLSNACFRCKSVSKVT